MSRLRVAWGRRGAREAARRGDLVVVVDTLSFSTAVVTAVSRGVRVWPAALEADAAALAEKVGATVSVPRAVARESGGFSLSPASFAAAPAGSRVVLRSPNGAGCCRAGAAAPALLIGCLLNAGAVGAAVRRAVGRSGLGATVVACGELHPDNGTLRVALEDEIGAGAIAAATGLPLAPEARAAAGAFAACRDDLEAILRDCESGRELAEAGYPEDPALAARLDGADAVPLLRDGELVAGGEAWERT